MTDTNQLPPSDQTGTQALWPQMIKALAEIDRALGLPDDGCNSLAQTLEAIRALQALRPERVPMTDEQIRSMCKQGWVFETVRQWVHVIEAHHGISAQDKKETP